MVLRDGSTVRLRPVRPKDREGLLRLFRGMSEASRALRFFAGVTDRFLIDAVAAFVDVDYVSRFGLVATAGPAQDLIGHACYVATGPGRAEVAFAVADAHQERGLGTILLGQLAEIGRANGIGEFEADVLPENHRMIEVIRESGFPVEVHPEAGGIHAVFPTALSEEALLRFEQRERIAAVNALTAFFAPRGVAVIGASRQRGTIAGEVFHNMLHSGFSGPVYAVNPAASEVQGQPAYPTVDAVPGPVDLAVVVVPAAAVVEVAAQCARKGVRALVVISAGFAEVGAAGRALQEQLLQVCRTGGMRLIGPNCMGIVNTDPAFRLHATFAPVFPPEGRVGFMSQSGALGLAVMDYAATLGLGLSSFASVGNKADISGNDLIQYWEGDSHTDVILLYLESFGNPRKFSRLARRIGRRKPIIAVKSGRSPAGARATSSHTGALLAASDVTVAALFRQAGVIRTDTLEELFDVAALLVNQPAPAGRRIGIVTNSGGPGILCADTAEAEGLEVPVLGEATQSRLRALLPPEASVTNPVDMVASATPDHYGQAVRIVAADPGVDALVVIFIPPLVTQAEDVARAIVGASRDLPAGKPLLTVFMSSRGVPEGLRAPDVRIPSYAFPEDAAIALARAARYGEWRGQPPETPPALVGVQPDRAAAIVAAALRDGDAWLDPAAVQALLACYGLPVLEQRMARTPAEVAGAASALGGPVALKAVAPGLIHKTEAGGVRLDLRDGAEARAAAEEMDRRLRAAGHPPEEFVVQRMAAPGVEMIVGVVHDPQFGPVLACGAGGVTVELLKDVAVRLTPLTARDAAAMIRELRTSPLLTGYRGGPAHDVAALEQVILRVSAMVEDLPQIAELDCNPVTVHERGASVLDARVRVAPADAPLPLGARTTGRRS